MRIVLLGPPGSGKSRLSQRIGEHCGIPVLTATNVLTRAAAEDSELGRLAKEAMDTNRVSDELLLALLRVRLATPELAGGFLVVDFPRNAGQADVLDSILDSLGRPLDLVLYLAVDPDELMERLVGRISCDNCGATYNLYTNPPTVEGVCDKCGARVNRRPGDYEETISNRLRIYDNQTGPLSQYYSLHGKLRKVSGDADVDAVWKSVRRIIDATPRTVLETEPVSEPPVPVDGREPSVAAETATTRTAAKKAPQQTKSRKAAAAEAPAASPKKPPAVASTTKKAVAKKAAKAEPAAKKAAPKKASPKAVAAQPPAAKKSTPKKAVAKKAVAKKAAAKKVAKKASPKKAPAKKVTAKKVPAKKAVAKKAVAKKAVGKKAVAKKVAAKKVVKKAVTKKAASRPSTTKKAVAKKVPAKKAVAKKAVAKKSAAKKAAKAKPKGRK